MQYLTLTNLIIFLLGVFSAAYVKTLLAKAKGTAQGAA